MNKGVCAACSVLPVGLQQLLGSREFTSAATCSRRNRPRRPPHVRPNYDSPPGAAPARPPHSPHRFCCRRLPDPAELLSSLGSDTALHRNWAPPPLAHNWPTLRHCLLCPRLFFLFRFAMQSNFWQTAQIELLLIKANDNN